MTLKATHLRQDVYRILDRVLETGETVMVERKGKLVRISHGEEPAKRLACLVRHDCIVGDPESLVHVDWSQTWSDEGQA